MGSIRTIASPRPRGEDLWAEERAEYLRGAQEDLHAILAVVQRSNELALKARNAAVSPFLLIDGDIPFSVRARDIDFAALRTRDAAELPEAVNSLTATILPDRYVQRYGALRVRRNRYAHLGNTDVVLYPVRICGDLINQYIDLWPNRPWLRDRVEMIALGRRDYFDDKHWSSRQEVMFGMGYEWPFIAPRAFRTLFGVKKSAFRFACHACHDDWAVSRNGPFPGTAPTSRSIARCAARISSRAAEMPRHLRGPGRCGDRREWLLQLR
ncbi:hypothetical protein FHS96_005556 [Sphingomonas zeicaulis]|uniref:hypothetical protein n=1 Tax=Sphingomonas zeicaulis TaxID=1632740 RepID=UPI003D1BFCFE